MEVLKLRRPYWGRFGVDVNGIFQCGILFAVMNRTVKQPTLEGSAMSDTIRRQRAFAESTFPTVRELTSILLKYPPEAKISFGYCEYDGDPIAFDKVDDDSRTDIFIRLYKASPDRIPDDFVAP